MTGQSVTGTLFGVGVGPGDPELITLKAHKLLARVPVIAYPAPVSGDSLARKIAAPHLPDGQPGSAGAQREIVIRMPLDPKSFPDRSAFDTAAVEIAEILDAGEDVAFICEGDPFFYGSFMYLFARLAKSHRVEVIPGITSLTACADALGAPLVSRNEVLTILPAPLPEADLIARLEATDAAAIIKIGRHAGKVLRVLEATGMMANARYIEHATMANQRITAVAELDPNTVPYFSMILARRGDIQP